ncbi:MAG: ABC transporter permease subunit, partial [Devosia sp.]|nr:ABC transporter permease subunit [Devosia sp.]
ASRWEIFRDLRLPGCMPFVFAGLRIAMPLAVVGAAVAEFVAAGQQAGLGSLVTIAAAQANLPVTWASIALLCLLGVLLVSLLALLRKRILWWSDEDVVGR